jgi:lysophospholipase L1-like esterase
VTFDGKESITIPAGAPALSDPTDLVVKPLSDLIVSVYAPKGVTIFDCASGDLPTDQAGVENADATQAEHLSATKCLSTRPTVSEVDVLSDRSSATIVAFGDSITDGFVDSKTGERGWPGALSRRLEGAGISVVDAGIGGNRLLQTMPMFGVSALSRLDRDVFSVPGLSHIVILEGINDIGMNGPGGMFGDTPSVDPQELIAAYSQIIARAHERGVKVFGATILPFKGAAYYSKEKEKVRSAVNEWIRTSKKFDGVVDFDAAMRDPGSPLKLSRKYDMGDHLHPNSAGYRHMGEVIDLHIFD